MAHSSQPFQLIAHRGLHRDVPENTLVAFSRALEAGAEAIELDVHATADGVLVVHHDEIVAGVPHDPALRGVPIADLTHAQVARFDVGGGHRAPTLTQALELLRGKALAYVEIKANHIEQPVVDCIRASGAQCAVHSFFHDAIERISEVAPDLPRGILEVDQPRDPAAVLAAARARDLWQKAHTIDEGLVAAVHAAGGRVIAWTANVPAEWARLARCRVDGICTDSVDDLRAWAGQHRVLGLYEPGT